ncbi:MAG: MBL fold metallo-hydrolase [Pleomorphochaeta sp.]
MSYKLTFLGTGTSHGVPSIGCNCETCLSKDPKDNRLRSSILLEKNDNKIIIDTGPEFRIQCLRAKLDRLDSVLYTHTHADHLNGIDDLRSFTNKDKPLPLYGDNKTIDEIKYRFSYIVKGTINKTVIPNLSLNELEPYKKVNINGFEITPLVVYHGKLPIFGYKIFNTAYLTDCNYIPKETMKHLNNLDVLILDALQHHQHKTHFTLEQAVEEAKKISAKQTFFTHIAHGIKHDRDSKWLPKNMELSYDTLSINLEE